MRISFLRFGLPFRICWVSNMRPKRSTVAELNERFFVFKGLNRFRERKGLNSKANVDLRLVLYVCRNWLGCHEDGTELCNIIVHEPGSGDTTEMFVWRLSERYTGVGMWS